MSILNDYSVSFSIKIFFNKDFKSMHSIDDTLTAYVINFDSVDRANGLLEIITKIVNLGGNAEVPTQSMYIAVIEQLETKIYFDSDKWFDNPMINADFMLPTSDFKVIVEAWKNYLEQ